MNRRKILPALLALLVLGATPLAEAQMAGKVPRIGYLGGSSALPFHDGFRGAFWQLGHREGENVVIDYRWSGGSFQRANEQAMELLQNRVDVIVAVGPASVLAARDAVRSIPIVFALSPDPVRNGLVELVIIVDQLLAIERVRIINFANRNHIPSASIIDYKALHHRDHRRGHSGGNG